MRGSYVCLATTLPIARAIALRSLLGGASLATMRVRSYTHGRRLFFLFRRWRRLSAQPEAGTA